MTAPRDIAMKGRTVLTVAILFAITVSVISSATAQITSVTIRVDGLSCPFCAYSLEKKVKGISGAKEPVINVEEGIVTLTPAGDKPIDLDDLREAVEKAGFTPRGILVEGVGRVQIIDGQEILVAEDGEHLFVLATNDVLARLQTAQTDTVTFSGSVTPRAKDNDASKLRTLELLSATPRGERDMN